MGRYERLMPKYGHRVHSELVANNVRRYSFPSRISDERIPKYGRPDSTNFCLTQFLADAQDNDLREVLRAENLNIEDPPISKKGFYLSAHSCYAGGRSMRDFGLEFPGHRSPPTIHTAIDNIRYIDAVPQLMILQEEFSRSRNHSFFTSSAYQWILHPNQKYEQFVKMLWTVEWNTEEQESRIRSVAAIYDNATENFVAFYSGILEEDVGSQILYCNLGNLNPMASWIFTNIFGLEPGVCGHKQTVTYLGKNTANATRLLRIEMPAFEEGENDESESETESESDSEDYFPTKKYCFPSDSDSESDEEPPECSIVIAAGTCSVSCNA